MAFLRKQGKYFHIVYWDKTERKLKSFTTKETNPGTAKGMLKNYEAQRTLNILPQNLHTERIQFSKAVELLLFDKEIKGLPDKTRAAYKTAEKIFINICRDKPIDTYTTFDIKKFIDTLTKEDYSPNTTANYTRHLHAVFNYALKNNYIDRNIMVRTSPVRKEVKPFEPGDLEELLNTLLKRGMKQHHDFVKLAYLCALRISEAVAVEAEDFDLANNTMYVRNSKGKRIDKIPILNDIKKHIKQMDLPATGRIFKFASKDSIKTFWNTAVKKLNYRYTFHQLRKTRGSYLANKGIEPLFLQRFMRHKDIRTTLAYYVKIDNEKMRNAMNKRLNY